MSVPITQGTGASSVAAEVVSGLNYQQIEVYGGGGSSVMAVNPDGSIRVSVIGTITTTAQQGASVSGTVGASVIGTVPVVQSGAWTTSIMGGPVSLFAPKASFVSGVTSIMTGTGLTSVLSAAGGSIKNYVTHIICSNGAATGTFVDIKDGGGNVIYSGYAAASGGGFVAQIIPPIVGSANKSVDAQPRTQASVIVAMSGYTDL
jgi:hypothetical protein